MNIKSAIIFIAITTYALYSYSQGMQYHKVQPVSAGSYSTYSGSKADSPKIFDFNGMTRPIMLCHDDAPTSDTTVGNNNLNGASKNKHQIGFAIGASASFPEKLKGGLGYNLSLIYTFDNPGRSGVQTGLNVYQKSFSSTLLEIHTESFVRTYLQLPLLMKLQFSMKPSISALIGPAASCVISKRYTASLYDEDFNYEIAAQAGVLFEEPLFKKTSFMFKALYEYPLFSSDGSDFKLHCITGSIGLISRF